MAPALAAGLPKSRVCRNIPRALLFGSKEYQGIGLHKLYTTMGINHIQALLDQTWSNSITGQLMQVSLENMKLELGLQGSVLNHAYSTYNHLVTKCWMEHLWEFTSKHDIEIDDEVGEIELLRERDSTLTQHFAQAEKDGKISRGE